MTNAKSPPPCLIGPAGWDYPDWRGIVYPPKAGRSFQALPYLAQYFDALEVDTTFYRIPDPIRTGDWVRQVGDFPRFRFAVKLFQGFTHTRKASLVDERAFHKALEPMVRFGKLSAVLVQWPWSFKNTPENRKALQEVLSRFSAYPLAVEVRHASWASKEVLALLRERGAAFCNIDQPELARCLGPTSAVTAPLAYFRFHGRNAAAWFAEGAGRDERYNYLYNPRELAPWVQSLQEASAVADTVVAIFNNHFRGKAVANAFQVQHALTGLPQPVPAQLIETYPELEDVSDTVFQRSLFGSAPVKVERSGKKRTPIAVFRGAAPEDQCASGGSKRFDPTHGTQQDQEDHDDQDSRLRRRFRQVTAGTPHHRTQGARTA